MVQKDISFHILSSYQWEFAQDIIKAPAIRSVLLLDPSIEQIQFSLQHTDFVVVRIFDPFNEYQGGANPDFEKAILDNHSPYEFVQFLNSSYSAFKGNSKLRFILGWNELYSKRGDREREQNQKMTAIGRHMIEAGYGVGLGGWAADKSFYQDDINNGHWDEIILFAIANPEWVSFDCHEYTVTRTAQQHLIDYPDGYPDSLLTPSAMQSDNFGVVHYESNSEVSSSGNWHIGRTAWLLERAIHIAGQHFKWYRGECAHDFKDDGALKDFMNNQFIPVFGKPRGVNTLYSYYTYIKADGNDTYSLPVDEYNQMLYEDYAWLALNSPDSNQANFIFAHNGNPDWVDFNTANPARLSFVNRIMQHEVGINPPDLPPLPEFNPSDFALYDIKSNTGGNVRVRDYPSLKSQILDVFFSPTIKQVAFVHPDKNIENYPVIADGWSWVYSVHEGGIGGWSAWE
jgi:hypothetical protein